MLETSYIDISPINTKLKLSNYRKNVDERIQYISFPTRSQQIQKLSLPVDVVKVSAQLKELTLEEKIRLLSGDGFVTTAGISRLGIPSMKV